MICTTDVSNMLEGPTASPCRWPLHMQRKQAQHAAYVCISTAKVQVSGADIPVWLMS